MKQKKSDAMQIPKHLYEQDEGSREYLHQIHGRDYYKYPDFINPIYLSIMSLAPEVALSEELGLSLTYITGVWNTWVAMVSSKDDMRHMELHTLELELEDYLQDLYQLKLEVVRQVHADRQEQAWKKQKELS